MASHLTPDPVRSMESILAHLDPEQREVVTAIKGPVCVIAGAGTGKTRVITHRIAYAIAAGVTVPGKVLALTFTARAAGEMRARLRSLGVPNATARTFHAAALKQLTYFWPYSFGGQFPSLLTMKSGFISESLSRSDSTLAPSASNLREIASEIEWAKALEIGPQDYVDQATTLGRELRLGSGRGDREKFGDIAKIYDAYETLKRQERAIDFEDVLLLTVGMLEEDKTARDKVRDQYRYFTVDEYQDVSPLQQRLLNLWLGTRDDICVVGDAAQTIYSFAGATSTFLLGFTRRFPEAQVIRLTRGYRSTPEIIGSANAVLRAGGMLGTEGHELASMNTSGAKPSVSGFNSAQLEAKTIAQSIRDLINQGPEMPEIAILTRTNSQLELFESALGELGVKTQVKSNERFFERTDVRDVMKVIRQSSVLPSEDGNWLDDVKSILRPFGDADYIQALIRLAQTLFDDGAPSMRTFLRELEDRAEQNNPPTLPGVILATLHAAKGLEWEIVYLAGVSDGLLPMGTAIDEERRLFYVGLTRAKSRIEISYFGQPSPFLSAISQ